MTDSWIRDSHGQFSGHPRLANGGDNINVPDADSINNPSTTGALDRTSPRAGSHPDASGGPPVGPEDFGFMQDPGPASGGGDGGSNMHDLIEGYDTEHEYSAHGSDIPGTGIPAPDEMSDGSQAVEDAIRYGVRNNRGFKILDNGSEPE